MQERPFLISHRGGQIPQILLDIALLCVPSLPLVAVVIDHVDVVLDPVGMATGILLEKPLQTGYHIGRSRAEPRIGTRAQGVAFMVNHAGAIVLKHRMHQPIEAVQRINDWLLEVRIRIDQIGQSHEEQRSRPDQPLPALFGLGADPAIGLDPVEDCVDYLVRVIFQAVVVEGIGQGDDAVEPVW